VLVGFNIIHTKLSGDLNKLFILWKLGIFSNIAGAWCILWWIRRLSPLSQVVHLYMELYTDVHIHCCSISHRLDIDGHGNTPRHTVLPLSLNWRHLDTPQALVPLLNKQHICEQRWSSYLEKVISYWLLLQESNPITYFQK